MKNEIVRNDHAGAGRYIRYMKREGEKKKKEKERRREIRDTLP